MGIKIQAKEMEEALKLMLIDECNESTNWLWAQVQSEAPREVRRDMIHKEVMVIAGQVVGKVSAAGIGALTTEWGSGSLADESNPAWDEYTQSKYYNPARFPHGHPITGRPKGEYINLDGETVKSPGGLEGFNLEGFLKPEEAQHWMRKIIALSRPTIISRLKQAIKVFPFPKYVHSDGK